MLGKSTAPCSRFLKLALLSSVLTSTSLAAFLVYSHSPRYKASGLLFMAAEAPYIAYPNQLPLNSDRYIETQKELLRSSVVLLPVLARPEIARCDEFVRSQNSTAAGRQDPLSVLQKSLTIRQVGRSDLYEVAYTSTSAEATDAIVNAVLAEYLAIQSDEKFRHTQRLVDILEEERRKRSLDVERLRQKVWSLAKDVTGRDPFTGLLVNFSANPLSLEGLLERIEELDITRQVLRRRLQQYSQVAESQGEPELSSDQGGTREQGEPANTRIDTLNGQETLEGVVSFLEGMQDLKSEWNENAEIVKLVDDLQGHQPRLEELKQSLQSHPLPIQSTEQQMLGDQHLNSELDSELNELNIQAAILKEHLLRRLRERRKHESKSVELEFAQAELAREQHLYELIATRKLSLQTELRAPTRVRLRQKATTPSMPINRFPYKLLLMGCLSAFVFSYTVVTALYLMKRGRCENSGIDHSNST